MNRRDAEAVVRTWPQESREAAGLVIDKYGQPDEVTEERLIWHNRPPWKRIVATRAFYEHHFPTPHIDCVESVIDYRVPPGKLAELGAFDGSVIVDRTPGEVSARCHDEEANNLALNLMHDIVTGTRTVDEARSRYKQEFLDYRRKRPTPYMEKLRVPPQHETADRDRAIISGDELNRAVEEGKSPRHAAE
jgi:hypothetical protein